MLHHVTRWYGTDVPEWLTPSQAAAYLQVTRQTIYRWCDEGRLPFHELQSGGGRRFNREDLDALLTPGSPSNRTVETSP